VARYTDDSIERVREAVDMVALVGAKTDLRRVGSRWVGLCPFHDERTPSFSVNGEEKLYYCFGCEAKGDAITFVRDTEALDFPEAVEFLAERHGVELKREHEDPRAEERRRYKERLYSLLERTSRFYAAYLWESGEAAGAREYLAGRHLEEDVLREFRVGYAPSAWDRVLLAAQRDGFSEQDLRKVGLAQLGRNGMVHDRFRGRIMFPLADWRGKVVGFGARALRSNQQPKYLNTSENDIYHKGRQLFGIDRARPQASKARRVVVVEGYTDVLALHQAGLREAVAIMGTALTEQQLAELVKAVGKDGCVYLALDADRSGREAMLRAAHAAKDHEIELRVVDMPEGTDPAELVAAGGLTAFSGRLTSALSVLEFEVERALADGDLDSPIGRDHVLDEVRPFIAAETGPAARESLIGRVADRLDMPATALAPTLTTRSIARPREQQFASADAAVGEASLAPEQSFLALCARSGDVGRTYLSNIEDDHLRSSTSRQARDHLLSHFEDPLSDFPDGDPELAAVLTRVALNAEEHPSTGESELRMAFLALDLARIERELPRSEKAGDRQRQRELAEAKQAIRRELDSVMGQTV